MQLIKMEQFGNISNGFLCLLLNLPVTYSEFAKSKLYLVPTIDLTLRTFSKKGTKEEKNKS